MDDVLNSEEDKYKSIVMASRDAIMTLEPPEWKFISGNPATLEMFKVKTEAEFLSYEPWKLSPEFQPDGKASAQKAKEMIEKAVREGSNLFEWIHRRTNGEDFYAEVLLSRIEDKRKIFLVSIVRDVTKRKNLEKQIAKNQQEQQIILDSIPAWVFYKDKENRFIKVNETFCKVMEKTKEDLEGKSMFDLYPKEQADLFWKDDLEVINSGKPKRNIIESMKSSKGELWLQTDKIPYKDEKGNIIGIIGFSVDITLRKLAEDEIKANNQELETLNKTMIGRELEMIKLKEKIKELEEKENT